MSRLAPELPPTEAAALRALRAPDVFGNASDGVVDVLRAFPARFQDALVMGNVNRTRAEAIRRSLTAATAPTAQGGAAAAATTTAADGERDGTPAVEKKETAPLEREAADGRPMWGGDKDEDEGAKEP